MLCSLALFCLSSVLFGDGVLALAQAIRCSLWGLCIPQPWTQAGRSIQLLYVVVCHADALFNCLVVVVGGGGAGAFPVNRTIQNRGHEQCLRLPPAVKKLSERNRP